MGSDTAEGLPVWQPHECELLTLVSLGLVNKEIAARLGVSETAIKKRLTRLMRRLAVENRTALVRAAVAAGLIDLSL